MSRRHAIALAVILLGGLVGLGFTDRDIRIRQDETALRCGQMTVQAISVERLLAAASSLAASPSADHDLLVSQLEEIRNAFPRCRRLTILAHQTGGGWTPLLDSGVTRGPAPIPGPSRGGASRITSRGKDEGGAWVEVQTTVAGRSREAAFVVVMRLAVDDWRAQRMTAARPPLVMVLLALLVLELGRSMGKRPMPSRPGGTLWPGHRRVVMSVAVCGALLTGMSTLVAHLAEERSQAKDFQLLAREKMTTIAKSLRMLHGVELEALARFYAASEFVSPREFQDYSDYLLRNPAVPVWGLVDHASGAGGAHFPLARVSSPDDNAGLLGFDFGSHAASRHALERAWTTRLPTCTDTLAVELQGLRGGAVTLFRPVFRQEDPARPRGAAVAILDMAELLREGGPTETVNLWIGLKAPLVKDSCAGRGPTLVLPVPAFDRTFFVTARAGDGYGRSYPRRAGALAGLTGILITVLCSVLVGLALNRREQLEAEVAIRTAELVDTQQRMDLAINGADLATWDFNLPADTAVHNDNWLRMMGFDASRRVLSVKEWWDLVHPDDVPEMQAVLAAHERGECEHFQVEHRMRHRDGHWLWVLAKGRVMEWSEDGKPVRACGTNLETTHLKQAQEALRRSETHLRTLLDTLPDIVWLKDPRGVYLDCNRKLAEVMGVSAAEVVGKKDSDFLDPALAAILQERDVQVIEAGRTVQLEEEIDTHSGERLILETLKTPMYDADGKVIGVLGVARDLTERRQAEEERRHLQSQLDQAHKMEAVGRLAGGVAHDLNNMLAPVIGYSELTLEDLPADSDLRPMVEGIKGAGFRARDLVRQLLAFSRKQPLQFESLDLNVIVTGFEELLRRGVPEDIDFRLVLKDGLPAVEGDRGQLEQVLMNLVVNAAHAMPDGGKLTVETGVVDLDQHYADTHNDVEPGMYAQMVVSDTGAGMDEETLARVFEPFFSTKGGEGTGLGLATVFGIIKQHSGSIWVYSEPGRGTTFKIYLPVCSAELSAWEARPARPERLVGQETIMLVEDQTEVRHLARTLLASRGYTVLEAAGGSQALSILRAHAGEVHLLLTDVVLPGLNGRQLYELASELRPDLSVIYMSGYTDNVIAHRGVLHKGINFLEKPFTMEALLTKVREVLDGIPAD